MLAQQHRGALPNDYSKDVTCHVYGCEDDARREHDVLDYWCNVDFVWHLSSIDIGVCYCPHGSVSGLFFLTATVVNLDPVQRIAALDCHTTLLSSIISVSILVLRLLMFFTLRRFSTLYLTQVHYCRFIDQRPVDPASGPDWEGFDDQWVV